MRLTRLTWWRRAISERVRLLWKQGVRHESGLVLLDKRLRALESRPDFSDEATRRIVEDCLVGIRQDVEEALKESKK